MAAAREHKERIMDILARGGQVITSAEGDGTQILMPVPVDGHSHGAGLTSVQAGASSTCSRSTTRRS
jgi:hypothetical protein